MSHFAGVGTFHDRGDGRPPHALPKRTRQQLQAEKLSRQQWQAKLLADPSAFVDDDTGGLARKQLRDLSIRGYAAALVDAPDGSDVDPGARLAPWGHGSASAAARPVHAALLLDRFDVRMLLRDVLALQRAAHSAQSTSAIDKADEREAGDGIVGAEVRGRSDRPPMKRATAAPTAFEDSPGVEAALVTDRRLNSERFRDLQQTAEPHWLAALPSGDETAGAPACSQGGAASATDDAATRAVEPAVAEAAQPLLWDDLAAAPLHVRDPTAAAFGRGAYAGAALEGGSEDEGGVGDGGSAPLVKRKRGPGESEAAAGSGVYSALGMAYGARDSSAVAVTGGAGQSADASAEPPVAGASAGGSQQQESRESVVVHFRVLPVPRGMSTCSSIAEYRVLEATARRVAANSQLELLLRLRQQDNPLFAFLTQPGHPSARFYEHLKDRAALGEEADWPEPQLHSADDGAAELPGAAPAAGPTAPDAQAASSQAGAPHAQPLGGGGGSLLVDYSSETDSCESDAEGRVAAEGPAGEADDSSPALPASDQAAGNAAESSLPESGDERAMADSKEAQVACEGDAERDSSPSIQPATCTAMPQPVVDGPPSLLAADSSESDSAPRLDDVVEAATLGGREAAAEPKPTSPTVPPVGTTTAAERGAANRPAGLLLAGYGSGTDSQNDDSDGSEASAPPRAQASAAVAVALQPARGRGEPTPASGSAVSVAAPRLQAQPAVAPEPPETIRTAVAKLCEYAARVGPAFISLVSAKEAANPRFAFLQAWSPWYAYFQAQLALVLPQQPPAATPQLDATAAGASAAGAATNVPLAAAEPTVGAAALGLPDSAAAGPTAVAGVGEAARPLPQPDLAIAPAEAEPLPDRIAWEEVAPTAGQTAGQIIADGAPAAAGEGSAAAFQAAPAVPPADAGLDGAGVRALLLEAATAAASVVRSKPKITLMLRSAAPQKSDAVVPPAGSSDSSITGPAADGLAAPAPASSGPGVASAVSTAFPVVDSSASPPAAPAADSETGAGPASGSQAQALRPGACSAIEPAPPAAALVIARARPAPPFLCTTSLPPPRLPFAARIGVSSATAASLARALVAAPVGVASPQLASHGGASRSFAALRDAGEGDGDVMRWGAPAAPSAAVSAPSAAFAVEASNMTGISGEIRDAAVDARSTAGATEVASAASAAVDAYVQGAGEEGISPDPGDWIDAPQGYAHYSSRAVAMALSPELFAVPSERAAASKSEVCGAELPSAATARSFHPSSPKGTDPAGVTEGAVLHSADTAGQSQDGVGAAAGHGAMPASRIVVGAAACMPPSHSTADASSSGSGSHSRGHVAAASPRGSSDSESGGSRSQRSRDRAPSAESGSTHAPGVESKSERVTIDDRRSRSRGSRESKDRGHSSTGVTDEGVARQVDGAWRAGDASRDERRRTDDADREQRNSRRQTSRERHASYRVYDSRRDNGRSTGGAAGGAPPLRDSRPWGHDQGDRSRQGGARAERYSRPSREHDDRFLDDDDDSD